MEVIEDWNSANSRSSGITLQALRWEVDSSPSMGARPQAIINTQMVRHADLLLGVFWTRIGTPTGLAASGTAEEIDQLVRMGKPVMLYFSEQNLPHNHDPEQFRLLNEYRTQLRNAGIQSSFKTPDELRRSASRDLARLVNDLVKSEVSAAAPIAAPTDKNSFARIRLMPRALTMHGLNAVQLMGEIENISSDKRITEFSFTLNVPVKCVSFTNAKYIAEIRSADPMFRKFRYTEQHHNRAQIFPGDTLQVISIDISVAHLAPEERIECLSMQIFADVLVNGQLLRLSKLVSEYLSA